MNREVLEKMTKEELIELIVRQGETISSLDEQRYNASATIEHLVGATHKMHDLRYRDSRRSFCQNRLDDWVREMYEKYPMYLVSAEKVHEVEDRLRNPIDLSGDMKGQPLKGEEEC